MSSIIGITPEETRAAEHGNQLASEDWPADAWPTPPRACLGCGRGIERGEGVLLCSMCESEVEQ